MTRNQNQTIESREMTVRCNAYGDGVRAYRVMVDSDGVRVWDPIAGHYTLCHRLSAEAQRRIARRLMR